MLTKSSTVHGIKTHSSLTTFIANELFQNQRDPEYEFVWKTTACKNVQQLLSSFEYRTWRRKTASNPT